MSSKLRPRRWTGIGDQEDDWFRETDITPEGRPPLAHAMERESWPAYVAWLLGAELPLTEMTEFQAFCKHELSEGKTSIECARSWLEKHGKHHK
jgi:hypothetical protein